MIVTGPGGGSVPHSGLQGHSIIITASCLPIVQIIQLRIRETAELVPTPLVTFAWSPAVAAAFAVTFPEQI